MDLNHLCSTKREIFGSMICESEPVLCSAVVSEHYEKDVLSKYSVQTHFRCSFDRFGSKHSQRKQCHASLCSRLMDVVKGFLHVLNY